VFKVKIGAHVGLLRILKAEGVKWISVFPSSGLNTPCGDEGVTNLMLRDERFAVAVADGFSRVSNRQRFGVCTVQGGYNSAGLQYAYGAARALEYSYTL
jgi:thiamine pyrophosphate-dependent acetolactate synthase large subunit-like protein